MISILPTALTVENKRFLFGNARLIGGHGKDRAPAVSQEYHYPRFPQGNKLANSPRLQGLGALKALAAVRFGAP
jgi:hypothetical protein